MHRSESAPNSLFDTGGGGQNYDPYGTQETEVVGEALYND